MRVDPEEFRRRFEDLSDDALLEINRDELVDVAQELYDAELERRGLLEEAESEESEPAEGTPDDPKDEMVLAGEFGSMQEVQFARALLKSAEIPSYLQTDFSGILSATDVDTKLYVPASYLEAAKEILDTPLTDEELEAQAEAAGEELEAEEAPAEEHEEQGHQEEGGLD